MITKHIENNKVVFTMERHTSEALHTQLQRILDSYHLCNSDPDFDNKEDMKKNNLVVEFMRLGYS